MIITYEEFKKRTGIHITVNHRGKMTGMQSLSTSCLNNNICQARAKDKNSICSKCYAQRQMKMYKNMDKCFTKNAHVLCNRVLDIKEFPLLNCAFFRLEAFSDLQNEIQLINYFNLCKANPHVKFALWSKNYWIIDNVIKSGVSKPKNLNIVLSSPYLNKVADFKRFDWVDRVFTVFDQEHAKDVNINCGGNSCLACQKCYNKAKKNYFINELLK